MPKKLRKKNIKRKNSNYVKLTGVLLQHYNGFKFDRKLSSHNSSNHKKFNNMLRSYLLECDKNDFTPNKEIVERKCSEFASEINDSNLRKENPEASFNPDMIDLAIKEMDFLPIVTRQNENSKDLSDSVYLKVIGLISLRNLLEEEIKHLVDCFSSDGEIDDGFFKISLMSVVLSDVVNERKQEKINELLKRKTRELLKKHFLKIGSDTKFKYSLKDKIKDFWLDGGI